MSFSGIHFSFRTPRQQIPANNEGKSRTCCCPLVPSKMNGEGYFQQVVDFHRKVMCVGVLFSAQESCTRSEGTTEPIISTAVKCSTPSSTSGNPSRRCPRSGLFHLCLLRRLVSGFIHLRATWRWHPRCSSGSFFCLLGKLIFAQEEWSLRKQLQLTNSARAGGALRLRVWAARSMPSEGWTTRRASTAWSATTASRTPGASCSRCRCRAGASPSPRSRSVPPVKSSRKHIFSSRLDVRYSHRVEWFCECQTGCTPGPPIRDRGQRRRHVARLVRALRPAPQQVDDDGADEQAARRRRRRRAQRKTLCDRCAPGGGSKKNLQWLESLPVKMCVVCVRSCVCACLMSKLNDCRRV